MTTMAASAPVSIFVVAADGPIDDSISTENSFTNDNDDTVIPGQNTYAFTPQRAQMIPRAWERKPATPFAPRNDAQKIWKRVQIPGLKVDLAEASKRGRKFAEETFKVLKRMKVAMSGHGGEFDEDLSGEDKENCAFAITKQEADVHWNWSPVRRKVHTAIEVDGRVMKLENMKIEDLLKGVLDETEVSDAEDSDDTISIDLEDDISHDPESNVTSRFEEQRVEHLHAMDSSTTANIVEEPNEPSVLLEALSPGSTSSAAETCQPELQSNHLEVEQKSSLEDESASPSDHSTHNYSNEMSASGTEEPDTCNIAAATDDQITNSNETISMHASESQPLFSLAQSEPTLIITDSCLDQDDTAFLHDFLKRAREQKAAKVSLILQPTLVRSDAAVQDPSKEPQMSSPVTSPNVEILVANSPNNQQDEIESDMKASSPCRRSSRMLTRLPRPQKPVTTLPNSIALKRLTGSEFISMQQESQSLALTTRSNTKRNRGEAVPVKMKLIQLQFLPPDDPAPQSCDTKLAVKTGKTRKEVSWDTVLARCQDGQQVIDQSVDKSSVTLVLSKDTPEKSEEAKEQTRKVRTIRKVSVGTVNGTPAPKRSITLVFGSESADTTALSQGDDTRRKLRTRPK